MDYEKLHKYTIYKLQQMVNSGKITVEIARCICADFVPESEDGGIRKELLDFCKNRAEKYSNDPKYKNISAWIAWLEKQGEQKPADKVEPKFHEGDWVVRNGETLQISGIDTVLDGTFHYWFTKGTWLSSKNMENAMLWTIQDAKAGDVLFCKGNIKDSNGIKYERLCLFNNLDNAFFTLTKTSNFVEEYDIDVNIDYPDNIVPATKKQKEILFMAMADAGYTFDFEKKALKKIEKKPDNDLPKGEDYGIDGLWHAERILEKTLGEVEGYQSDDGILEHKCAISSIKELKKMKQQNWSEEDENHVKSILSTIECCKAQFPNAQAVIEAYNADIDWLKSLRPQSQWKPDSSMLICLEYAIKHINKDGDKRILSKLLEQLKKLREE